MKAYAPGSIKSRALAAACAVVANVLVLGGMLALFEAESSDAMLAKAKTNAAPAAAAVAERALLPRERG